MHLSEKQRTFFEFFSEVFSSTLNFEIFQKKMAVKVYVFPKLRALKELVRYKSKKSYFRGPLHRQRGKRVETLFQSQQQRLYHIN